MKKLFALLLAASMVLALSACGGNAADSVENVKIGMILSSDGTDPYEKSQLEGLSAALEANGMTREEHLLLKTGVTEVDACYNTCAELTKAGCIVIFVTSNAYQAAVEKAAAEFAAVQFVSILGNTAALSGLDNLSNGYNRIHEARYVSGVVAGLKLAELDKAKQISKDGYDEAGNVKIGFVGAFPSAEVVSGYTAFYLGVKSAFSKVVMSVQYANTMDSAEEVTKATNTLIDQNCVIIGHHTNSSAVATAVQTALDGGKVVYCVGFQEDILTAAPTAALTSAVHKWASYYTYAISQALKGDKIAINRAAGYDEGAVGISTLGPAAAGGTADRLLSVESALKDGSLQVFGTSSFTVGGEQLTSAMANVIPDAGFAPDTQVIENGVYYESTHRAAPYFELRIDGIKELNAG